MIVKKKKGALISATFSRKSPTVEAEIEAFTSELRKLKATHPQFLVSEKQSGDTMEVDVFPAKTPNEVATKKLQTMSADEAAKLVKSASPATAKEKQKTSPLAQSTAKGAGFKKKR